MSEKNETAPNGGPTKETASIDSSTNDVTLEKVLQNLREVKPTKNGYMALCEFHPDKNPSMLVRSDGSGFYCFGCKEHGPLSHLARKMGISTESLDMQKEVLRPFRDHLSKRLAIDPIDVDKIASRLNIWAENGQLRFKVVMPPDKFICYVKYEPGFKSKYKFPAGEYFEKKGVTLKGSLFGLDLALNAYKINHLDKNISALRGSLLLTEGIFDALGCLAQPETIAAAAIMGGVNPDPAPIYKVLVDAKISHVVLCFDNDDSGRQYTLDYLTYFVKNPEILTEVILLERYKDLNEALQADKEKAFIRLEPYKYNAIEAFMKLNNTEEEILKGEAERRYAIMNLARFYSEMHPVNRRVVSRETFIERLGLSEEDWQAFFEALPIEREKERIKNELAREGRIFLEKVEDDPVGAFQRLKDRGEFSVRSLEKRRPVSVAEELSEILKEIQHEGDGHKLHDSPGLDKIIVQPVDLVTVAAGTGVGKTTFALNIADYFLRDKKRVLFVSYEINRGRLLSQLVAIRTNKKKSDVYRNLKKGEKVDPETVEGLSIIADPGFTVEELARLVGKYQEERPLDLIIVDYDQLAQTEGRFDNEERRVSFISQTLKGITLDYGVPVILLSQISKEGLLRFSRQKEFDSSIVLKLEPPKLNNDEEIREYYEKAVRKVVVVIDKYRDGQAKVEHEITIDFETGRVKSEQLAIDELYR